MTVLNLVSMIFHPQFHYPQKSENLGEPQF